MEEIGVYVIITNPELPYGKIAEICVKNNVKMLQLREKHLSDRRQLEIAREIKSVVNGSQTMLCIDDRIDIATLSNADCLHLGQTDITIEDARRLTNNSIKIGLSTHSIEQAKEALTKNPDYIGFGPVYPTTTKEIPDPVVGCENLKTVLGFSNVPVVAIGGIFPENINTIIDAGAKTFCLVRHLMQTNDASEFEKRLKYLQSLLNKNQN